jgi:hypothetical protein
MHRSHIKIAAGPPKSSAIFLNPNALKTPPPPGKGTKGHLVQNKRSKFGQTAQTVNKPVSPYHLELLPQIPPFHRRARIKHLNEGQLVYYGPQPVYYGIGEVVRISDRFIVVDFRGTGQFGVHEDVFEPQYLIPIPSSRISLL